MQSVECGYHIPAGARASHTRMTSANGDPTYTVWVSHTCIGFSLRRMLSSCLTISGVISIASSVQGSFLIQASASVTIPSLLTKAAARMKTGGKLPQRCLERMIMHMHRGVLKPPQGCGEKRVAGNNNLRIAATLTSPRSSFALDICTLRTSLRTCWTVMLPEASMRDVSQGTIGEMGKVVGIIRLSSPSAQLSSKSSPSQSS